VTCFAYLCIIHQEALCIKVVNLKRANNMVTKIINSVLFVRLKHRLFKAQMEGVESEYSDLILHTEFRPLRKCEVLSKFLELIPKIQELL
jgi:hypothetical protein